MTSLSDQAIAGYTRNAPTLIARYNAMSSAALFREVADLFPPAPARVLDVGAGTGRDARWLHGLGYAVTAVEPVAGFRKAIQLPIDALDDRLPDLDAVSDPFDLIIVNGVWQHLSEADRAASWATLAARLSPGGRVVVSLRHGMGAADIPVAGLRAEVEIAHAARTGLKLLRQRAAASIQPHNMAAGVTWTWLALAKEAAP